MIPGTSACYSYVLSISEDLPGWSEFLEKLRETFPEIPKDWYIDICLPAFATNFSVIYNRSPDILLTGRRLELKLEPLSKWGVIVIGMPTIWILTDQNGLKVTLIPHIMEADYLSLLALRNFRMNEK